MMGYNEEYSKNMESYKELLNQYNELTESEQYKNIYGTMTFEFLSARQLAETLAVYSEVGSGSKFKFLRANDAASFYHSVIDLRKNISSLLESATCIVKASELVEKINKLVEDSPFLPDSLKLSDSSKVTEMAKDCVQLLPNYPNLLTKAFKKSFIESCIDCLSKEDVVKLADENIIRQADMSNLSLIGSNNYKENIKSLQEKFGIPALLSEHHEVKLAGTSHNNEDGSSRQDYLKELSEIKNAIIKCTSTIFTPEIGDPKNAIEVSYSGKIIGYIPQGVVDDIFEKYKDPEFEAKLVNVIGGGKVNYGCIIDLGIVAKEFKKEQPEAEVER